MKYTVPSYKIPAFAKKIAVLNKRAEKIGAPEIIYEIGGSKLVDVETRDGFIKVTAFDINVEGFTPMYDGWKVVSRFTHDEGTTLSSSVNGLLPPEEYRNITEPYCEHCGTKRVKKRSVLLYNRNEGYKVVGRECMKKFVDRKLEELLSFYERFADFANEIPNEYSFSGAKAEDYRFEPREVVALSSRVINKEGYVTVTSAIDDNTKASKDYVVEALLNRVNYNVKDSDYEMADKAIEWVLGVDAKNEYMANLKTLAGAESVNMRSLGYLVSLIPSYKKALERTKEAESYKDEYIGEVKERREFDLEIIFKTSFETMYGTTIVYSMKDEENRLVTWMATTSIKASDENNNTVYAEVGDKFKMMATIKKHEEYRGNKVTYINRGKLTDDSFMLARLAEEIKENERRYTQAFYA